MAPTLLALRLQETRAVMLLAEVPMAEPGARSSTRGARPHGSWNRWLFLPSAASTAALRAVSPSTSSSPCALQQPGGQAEEGGSRGGSERRSAPAQGRWRPGGEKRASLQPAPPGALQRQWLRRTREQG